MKNKRKFPKILFFLFLLASPLSTAVQAFGYRTFVNLLWLSNALIFAGISCFGLPAAKLVKLKGFYGRMLATFVIPTAVAIPFAFFLIFFILIIPLRIVLTFLHNLYGESMLIYLAFLTVLFLEVLGVLRFYFDGKIARNLGFCEVRVGKFALIFVILFFFVSALCTEPVLHYSDLANTWIASKFRKTALVPFGMLVRVT